MERAMAAPDKLRIPYEDWEGARFEYVGRCGGGSQFMVYRVAAAVPSTALPLLTGGVDVAGPPPKPVEFGRFAARKRIINK